MVNISQKETWNAIAEQWRRLRTKMYEDAKEFLKDRRSWILDLGCGSGRNFIGGKKYIGIDFSENMLRYAKQSARKKGVETHLIKADLAQLPLKSNIFGTVLLVATLHTLEKRVECVEEMKRIMCKSGKAFVSVWNRMQPRFFLSKEESFIPWKVGDKVYFRYYRLFTKDELRKMLSGYFFVEKIHGSKEKALKLFPKNIIAIVRKY